MCVCQTNCCSSLALVFFESCSVVGSFCFCFLLVFLSCLDFDVCSRLGFFKIIHSSLWHKDPSARLNQQNHILLLPSYLWVVPVSLFLHHFLLHVCLSNKLLQ